MKTGIMVAAAICGLAMNLACGDSAVTPGSGTVVVQLTDSPFPLDSIQSVDIFVLRIDGRRADLTAEEANDSTSEEGAAKQGWTTLASPNASVNLLTLQNGTTSTLGQTAVASGSYAGFRLIIDPVKSSITLKNGMKLDGGSNPGVSFPSATRSGIKIQLSAPMTISTGGTTTIVVDFDVGNSFVMRGSSLSQNGLLFTPLIKGTTK